MGELHARLVEILSGDEFTSVANVLSVIGFVLTLYVSFAIRNIRKYYIFTARVPELVRRLKEHNSKISELLNDYENSMQAIDIEIASMQVILNSLKSKISGNGKKSTRELISQTKSYNLLKKVIHCI
jgi:predicted PurR-regulated permease PerM